MAQEKKNKSKQPKFPFDKMPHQEKSESGEELSEYEMEANEELDLGESESRKRKRTLDDEKNAGHEP